MLHLWGCGIMLGVVLDLVADELDRLHGRIRGRFARAEPRARVRRYVSGLVAGLERVDAGRTCLPSQIDVSVYAIATTPWNWAGLPPGDCALADWAAWAWIASKYCSAGGTRT